MFRSVFSATATSWSSERLAVFSGATGHAGSDQAMFMAHLTARVEQPSITLDNGYHAMQTVPFIANCNKASVR